LIRESKNSLASSASTWESRYMATEPTEPVIPTARVHEVDWLAMSTSPGWLASTADTSELVVRELRR
jgi:hypothetical protein